MARPELDQVAGVRDVRQLCHFHKVLLRRTAAWTGGKNNLKRDMVRYRHSSPHISPWHITDCDSIKKQIADLNESINELKHT